MTLAISSAARARRAGPHQMAISTSSKSATGMPRWPDRLMPQTEATAARSVFSNCFPACSAASTVAAGRSSRLIPAYSQDHGDAEDDAQQDTPRRCFAGRHQRVGGVHPCSPGGKSPPAAGRPPGPLTVRSGNSTDSGAKASCRAGLIGVSGARLGRSLSPDPTLFTRHDCLMAGGPALRVTGAAGVRTKSAFRRRVRRAGRRVRRGEGLTLCDTNTVPPARVVAPRRYAECNDRDQRYRPCCSSTSMRYPSGSVTKKNRAISAPSR